MPVVAVPNTLRPTLAALAALVATALPVTAQTVIVPAPPRPSPRPAWNCRAAQPVGTGEIRAARMLDAAGARLQDMAGWTDAFTADRQAPLTVSVEWRGEGGTMIFAEGMANFWVRNAQPLKGPLTMSLAGRRAIAFNAGPGYSDPRAFSAYERIGKVLDAAGDAAALQWAVRGTVPGKGATVGAQGSYALTELTALAPAFARVLAELDAMQADHAKRCRRL